MEMFFSVLQLIGGIILVAGYPAQLWKIHKTKSSKDFSITWLSSIALGIALMEMYAVYCVSQGVAQAFFITNTLALTAVLVLLGMVHKHRRGQ
jgi:uncharacterized protein with PQ loop repeat